MSAAADATGYEVVFTCDGCGSDYRPTMGECPECGDWAFSAAVGPGPVGRGLRVVGPADTDATGSVGGALSAPETVDGGAAADVSGGAL